ncbi:MAG: hypothetical protein K5695_15410 [Oscillospiraceae bacterium]|nr:hypothetical protein [Oscillospiraceae bacterium]
MTVPEFVKRTKVRLAGNGKDLFIPPSMVKAEETREEILDFARQHKPQIVAFLMEKQRKMMQGENVAASVQAKVIEVLKAWDEYLFEENQYLASNCQTEAPTVPEVDPKEAFASLNEQERAYYTAYCFAESTDIEKARLGELAMMDIAEASFNFEHIVARMKRDYVDLCEQRNTDAEMERRAALSENATFIQNMRMTG